jgi:RNA polymerase sigma-70 factor, ECF subfamily
MTAVTGDPLRPLLEAASEGDDVAAAELVRRTQADVWRICTMLGSPGEEEDLAQETYLRALRSLPSYRGEAPVRAWLLRIARNVCADHVRRKVRQRRLIERVTALPVAEALMPQAPSDELLDGLSPERREAFVLTQLLGYSYEDAAAVLDCPIGTIRSRVARARADLVSAVQRAELPGG